MSEILHCACEINPYDGASLGKECPHHEAIRLERDELAEKLRVAESNARAFEEQMGMENAIARINKALDP